MGKPSRVVFGIQLLENALKIKPDDPYVMDSFGWVLYKMGKNAESLEYLRKVYAKSDESNPETAAHLAEVLYASGSKDEAKAVFEKALKDFPDNEKLKEAWNCFMP